MIIEWRNVKYDDCCPLGKLCDKHLAKHRAACGWPAKVCDVCETQNPWHIKVTIR